MAALSQDLFQKFKEVSKLPKKREVDGEEAKADIREDEEQSTKYQEIIDLLVAAGYFRARIKGISPFDKVVGGMTWCIELLDVDIDVDLLFQENSTIGQKISLTEKIVAVLPQLKCPHAIEPHQIQGLDFIHIFPVMQWLIKVSMEARQDKSSTVRSYAIHQFRKDFPLESGDISGKSQQILNNIKFVTTFYRNIEKESDLPPDTLSKIQTLSTKYLRQTSNTVPNAEQNRLEWLLGNLSAIEEILQDEDLEENKQKLFKYYDNLHSELMESNNSAKTSRESILLQQEDRLLEENLSKLKKIKNVLETEVKAETKKLKETEQMQLEVEKNLKDFEADEVNSPSAIKEIEELVILRDKLKAQETEFKEKCKGELAALEKEINDYKETKSPIELSSQLLEEINEYSEGIKKIRLKLAKKNQITAKLHRQLDDIPNRAEMGQYQKRFLELYNQVAAKHKETKQYYTLYNTLENKRMYMMKELSILNSISENYPEAMQSSRGKDEFLGQLKTIVDGVHQTRLKLEKQVTEEKGKRDYLGDNLQALLELQRSYAAAVKQLSRHVELLKDYDHSEK